MRINNFGTLTFCAAAMFAAATWMVALSSGQTQPTIAVALSSQAHRLEMIALNDDRVSPSAASREYAAKCLHVALAWGIEQVRVLWLCMLSKCIRKASRKRQQAQGSTFKQLPGLL